MPDETQGQTDVQPQDTETAPETSGESKAALFTQEQVDALVKERIKREKTKYADYEDLKAKAAKVTEFEDAQKSELEKAQEKAEAMRRDRDALAAKVNDKLIKAEIRMIAAQLGFTNPEDAYHLADIAGLEVDEDGNVKGAAEALQELAKNKPYLLKPEGQRPAPPKADAGVGNAPVGGEALTPGMESLMQLAANSGYAVDPERIRQFRANARLVTANPSNNKQ